MCSVAPLCYLLSSRSAAASVRFSTETPCSHPAHSLRSSGAWSQCTGQLDGLIDGTIGDLLFGSGCSDGGQAAAAAVDKDMPVLGQEVKATEGEEEQEEEPQKGACRGSLEASLDGNLALAAAAAASGTSA